MKNRAITVSQLNNYIKQVFEAEELLHGIEVVGDIDGIRQHGSAVYFTLKDAEACVPCVCYFPAKMKSVENGSQVVVRGTVSYWHKAGKISFVVTSCESFGFGALFLQFQQLKEKLQAEGLFSAGVKKPLPQTVKRVGVVTSRTGAVIHDITTVAHRRNPAVDIVLYPVAVQGSGADTQIAAAIEFLSNYGGESQTAVEASASGSNKKIDAIIVARGGGSKEDLAAFNSERVARACFASKVPVVSAVGHETDWTLIDFVADLRAATPSAAAELVVSEVLTQRELVVRASRHLTYTVKTKYDNLFAQIRASYGALRSIALFKFQETENRIGSLANFLESNNPLAVLRRGYAKVFKNAAEITGVEDIKIGDNLQIKMYNGEIGATVCQLTKK